MRGILFDIKKYAIHDGPGIRTTVFFKGCPLRCQWCHNPESQAVDPEVMIRENRCIRCGACVEVCPQDAIYWNSDSPHTDSAKCARCGTCAASCNAQARECIGREYTVRQVIGEIERDIPFYDESGGGVTLSGGEPLLQSQFAGALLRECKDRDVHTALDTCGYASWETINRLRKHVDLFLYDVKLIDDDKHRKFTGVSNQVILSNLKALSCWRHNILLRVPVIPGVNDADDDLEDLGRFAAALPCLSGLELLPYHRIGTDKYARLERSYALSDTQPPSAVRMEAIREMFEGMGLSVRKEARQ